MAHGLHHSGFKLGATLFGHTGMGDKTTGRGQHQINAHFLGSLGSRDRVHAVLTKDHQRAEIAGFDRGRSLRQVQRADIDGTGDNLGGKLTTTTERDVGRHVDAKALGPQEDGQMVDGARRSATEFHRVAILHAGNEFLRRLVGAGLAVDHQDLRVVSTTRDRRHVLDAQIGLALRHGDGMTNREGQNRVAIGRAAVEILHRGSTATTTLVDDDHILLQPTACADHHHARVHVGTTTGTGVGNNLDRAFGGDNRCRRHGHNAGHRRDADADRQNFLSAEHWFLPEVCSKRSFLCRTSI